MKNLKLKRVSALPNQFNNYCYVILSGDTKGMSGIVERDGVKMLFSFSRIGSLSQPINAQADERKVGEKTYFNLIDTTADSVGEVAHLASIAKRAGLGANAVDAEAAKFLFSGLNTKSKAQSQPIVTEAVTAEQPQEQPEENKTTVSKGASVEEE